MRPEIPPRTKPLEVKLRRAKIPDHYVSTPRGLDRMVTQIPEEKVIPTPTQVEGQVKIVTPEPKKKAVPTSTERKSEKKMTLVPPKKKDNPKLPRKYKKNSDVLKDDPNRKKYQSYSNRK